MSALTLSLSPACVLALALAMAGGSSLPAQTITVRISAKVLKNPANGNLPGNSTVANFSDLLRGALAKANAQSGNNWWRGYRFELVGDVIAIGQMFPPGDAVTGPSKYYHGDVYDPDPDPNDGDPPPLRAGYPGVLVDGYNNPATYAWSTTALNLYYAADAGGSYCGCVAPNHPTVPEATVYAGIFSQTTPADSLGHGYHLAHEIGHFFDPFHTFAGSGCTGAIGDDGIADTLPDRDCATFDQNGIASYHFAQTYAWLQANNPAGAAQVDNVWFNLMSYHDKENPVTRLTEGQLNKWTDAANSFRHHVVSGYTRHVSKSGSNGNAGTVSAAPKLTLAASAASAAAGDIILLRQGNYNETLTINKAVTLRVPRNTVVNIGKP